MPTELLAARAAAARCLSWPDTARLLFLLARVGLLNLRLNALYRLVGLRRRPLHGGRLLRLMRRWLAIHDAVGRLLPGIALRADSGAPNGTASQRRQPDVGC